MNILNGKLDDTLSQAKHEHKGLIMNKVSSLKEKIHLI